MRFRPWHWGIQYDPVGFGELYDDAGHPWTAQCWQVCYVGSIAKPYSGCGPLKELGILPIARRMIRARLWMASGYLFPCRLDLQPKGMYFVGKYDLFEAICFNVSDSAQTKDDIHNSVCA
jgi:hypothetical protein